MCSKNAVLQSFELMLQFWILGQTIKQFIMKKSFLSSVLFVMAFSVSAIAQQITGVVTDENGSPLPGATIQIDGTNNGVTTDFDGNYSISAAQGDTLNFSYVGYSTQSIQVEASDVINVQMVVDNALDEVVVTSLGINRQKKTLSYSVTQVGGDEFVESRTANLGNALTGKVAGVNIQAPTTGAAGSTRVTIRGGSSLSGDDQPLYIVNGIPIETGNFGQAGMWGGNDTGDGLTAINPDDIESISVLKGNTASALYGSRAANGVILITTKSGTTDQGLGISYNSNFTFDQVIDRTDYQRVYGNGLEGSKFTNQNDAYTYALFMWGAKYDGSSVVQFDGQQRPYKDLGYTLNDYYNRGYTRNNTIAINGGNESGNFRFSASDLDNQDIVPNASLKRNTFNLAVNSKKDRLTFDASINYSINNAKNRPNVSDRPQNFNIIQMHPFNIPLDDIKGPNGDGTKEDGNELNYSGNIFLTNPFFHTSNSLNNDVTDRVLGSISVKYDIIDGLYALGRIGTDAAIREETKYAAYGLAFAPTGQYFEEMKKITQNNYEFILGGNKSIGSFNLDYLAGISQWRKQFEQKGIYGLQLVVPFFASINNIASPNKIYSFFETGQNSVFGNLNVGYDDWVFLNFSVREDVFSTLAVDNNSSIYPSAGASIILSEKLNLPEFISFAKLRASWAEVGGGGPNPYATVQTFSLGEPHGGAFTGSYSSNNVSNPLLGPYTSTEYEIGTNLRLFSNALEIDAAYYKRNTTNDILATQISGTSGFTGTTVNIGELENKGYELLINANIINKADFKWNSSFNFAHNMSKAINLGLDASGNPIEKLTYGNSRLMIDSVNHLLGDQLGVIMGFKQRTGPNGELYYDANGDPVRTAGYEKLGYSIHPNIGGWSNTFTYKNWSLYTLVDFRQGGSIFSGTNWLAYYYGLHQKTLQGRNSPLTISGLLFDGTETNTPLNVTIPANRVDDHWRAYGNISNNLIYDGSYGKLRELSVKYNFPSSMLADTFIKSASLSLVGRNLALLWSHTENIDPESAFSATRGFQGLEYNTMPLTRSIGVNLNVNF